MITVVMASYLGYYPRCASNRVSKFHRAIQSVLDQTFQDWKLIIVSDGCEITNFEAEKYIDPRISLIKLEKQPLFSGNVRATGVEKAEGIICYLDTDDFFGKNHLQLISDGFQEPLTYWDDYVAGKKRHVEPRLNSIGTSCIAHTTKNWYGCDGYGHDWTFISQFDQFHKIKTEYQVCHIPGKIDL
jgi:glycosyltransferase involved in cell wall biosynthesis